MALLVLWFLSIKYTHSFSSYRLHLFIVENTDFCSPINALQLEQIQVVIDFIIRGLPVTTYGLVGVIGKLGILFTYLLITF